MGRMVETSAIFMPTTIFLAHPIFFRIQPIVPLGAQPVGSVIAVTEKMY